MTAAGGRLWPSMAEESSALTILKSPENPPNVYECLSGPQQEGEDLELADSTLLPFAK